ncbi:MAG: hypothetical protein EFT35_06210 [Methanophagales archaeon ANME-1-THS]|nr:MAG: hypothetical protein EFT35_06210 [Methanophagales archaeon ANME-1-THS]
MRVFDVLLGRVKPAPSKTDALFSISTAYVTLETNLEIKHAGKAGICFKIVPSTTFERVNRDLDELLQLARRETATEYKMVKDDFGYLWIVLSDPDFEDLVTTLHLISNTLIENGFGEQLLSSVFKFEQDGKFVYLMYTYKKGRFYPFVPLKDKERDLAYELKLSGLLEAELPMEKERENWYPMWDIPL